MALIRTKTDLAATFGCSRNAVDKWTRKADFPGGRQGPWRVESVTAWLAANDSPYAPQGGGESDVGKSQQAATAQIAATARALKLREEHRKLKLHNDVLEGKLVHREDVERCATELTLKISRRLQDFPAEIEQQLPVDVRATVVEDLASAIRLLLLEMSRWEPIE